MIHTRLCFGLNMVYNRRATTTSRCAQVIPRVLIDHATSASRVPSTLRLLANRWSISSLASGSMSPTRPGPSGTLFLQSSNGRTRMQQTAGGGEGICGTLCGAADASPQESRCRCPTLELIDTNAGLPAPASVADAQHGKARLAGAPPTT